MYTLLAPQWKKEVTQAPVDKKKKTTKHSKGESLKG